MGTSCVTILWPISHLFEQCEHAAPWDLRRFSGIHHIDMQTHPNPSVVSSYFQLCVSGSKIKHVLGTDAALSDCRSVRIQSNPDTRSVCHFHNNVASTKRQYSTRLGSVCAALVRREESPPSSGIESWLHRGAATMPSTASQRRPAMVSLVETEIGWESIATVRAEGFVGTAVHRDDD